MDRSEAATDRRPDVAVVIPVKSFDLAKERLAPSVEPERRAELARRMAEGVVAAARPLPTFVVCGAPDVAAWAVGVRAGVIHLSAPGLNRAVHHAAAVLAADGVGRVIVAHGDLPLARSLGWVGEADGVTIVPDRRDDGTNVLSVPLGVGFRFRYGPGSAAAHRAEAERLGLEVRIAPDPALGWDVDVPADLTELPAEQRP
ncbi:MAG: 2-phospho-L-lactate guanylyltransferase [Actinomycetota bacterium]